MTTPRRQRLNEDRVQEVRRAAGIERLVRRNRIGALMIEGHVVALPCNDPFHIHIQVGEQIILCDRSKTFPTVKDHAMVELAVAAGQTCRTNPQASSSQILRSYRDGKSYREAGAYPPSQRKKANA
jgi:hypothetical protein